MPIRMTLLFLLPLLWCCALGTSTSLRETRFHGWGFQVQIPPGVTVKKEQEEEADFGLYYLYHQDGTLLVSIYAGNHPDCPQLDIAFDCDIPLESPSASRDERRRHEGKDSREGLLLLQQENPAIVHFWYSDLPQTKAELADRIVASIQSNPKAKPERQ